MLESGNDYTLKAKEAATTILELRNIEHKELVQEAEAYWVEHLKQNIKSYLLSKIKPVSTFLDDQEMGDLFKEAYNKWKENQKTFEIDTTKYWFV